MLPVQKILVLGVQVVFLKFADLILPVAEGLIQSAQGQGQPFLRRLGKIHVASSASFRRSRIMA